MSRPLIIVPLSGSGSRFPREKWPMVKPLILVDDKSVIEWSMSAIDYTGCDLVFVVRQDHVTEYAIDAFLEEKFPNCNIIIIQEKTRGAVETCLAAKKFINRDAPVIVHCSDVYFEPVFSPIDFHCANDGCILTFKSNSPNYSYSKIENKYVIEVAEKKVISSHASVGIYYFKRGEDFLSAAKEMVNSYSGSELHLALIYNFLIKKGKKITTQEVDKIYIFGTDQEFEFFTKNILPSFPENKKVVALASDHSGFSTKKIFKEILAEKGIKVIDCGTFSETDINYSEFIRAATKTVLEGKAQFGAAFCRSGQGVNIAANKIKGIRSALCYNDWAAEMAVSHNCSNFFCFAEKFNDKNSLEECLDKILNTKFQGGRHQTRLMNSES